MRDTRPATAPRVASAGPGHTTRRPWLAAIHISAAAPPLGVDGWAASLGAWMARFTPAT